LDFGCGFGFLNPKPNLNQNIQKTKKPHPKPNHKIKKTKNQIQNQSKFLVFQSLKIVYLCNLPTRKYF
jgi:hypothetical protein